MTETKNFQWLLVPSFESLFQGVNYEVTMSCALMANYYISWRLQNIVTSSKYINIQRSWKVRVTSCYSILMTSHYFEVSKIQINKPLRLPHGLPHCVSLDKKVDLNPLFSEECKHNLCNRIYTINSIKEVMSIIM